MDEEILYKSHYGHYLVLPISHRSPPHPSGHEQLVLGYEQFPPFIQNPGLQSAIQRDIMDD